MSKFSPTSNGLRDDQRGQTGLIGTNCASSFVSYRTGHYKLHYYETPTSLKFVMVTDTKTNNLRIVLHQIYVSLYVEYGKFSRQMMLWTHQS